eukprot:TRINITY_DN43597_c0_g1_i2.p1 TRINITY_DN43597_c0_g1~~TRINITY_DN43597_c0_g1_i2.p1  ORF type:complete len:289 (+),score=56.66 TRINITY_DN43597_c0_g1_i2:234-1100(+)
MPTSSVALPALVASGVGLARQRRQGKTLLRRTTSHRGRSSGVARCAVVEDDSNAIAVRKWLNEFVIGMNFCPFAKPADEGGHVRIVTSLGLTPESVLEDLTSEAMRLPPDAGGEEPAKVNDGVPTTTIVVCPYVLDWQSFAAYQAFYCGPLRNGYIFKDQDLYIAPFHPFYGSGCPSVEAGDTIELSSADGPMQATVLDPNCGFGEARERLAKVKLETGEETFICLPSDPSDGEETDAIPSRAPRPLLHLLRSGDLDRAEDPGLLDRNRRRARDLGTTGIDELMRRCG